MYSIVMPSYIIDEQCKVMEELCKRSVYRYTTAPFELIVVNSYPENRLTYAQAVNKGMKQANGKFIVILNNDIEVAPKWIESMTECFTLPHCGIGTLLGSEHFQLKKDEIIESFYGPCWMISRKAYEKIGELDEQFINSYEDSDYWVRTYMNGYKIYRNMYCVVKHGERKTCKKITNDSNDIDNNRKLFIEKYGELNLDIYKRLKG